MNLTTEQKKAAALIFAADADGKSIEWHDDDAGWTPVDPFDASNYTNVLRHPSFYRIAPDPIAPGWNPDKLTVAQVGEGWRLLDEDEMNLYDMKRERKPAPTILAHRWDKDRWNANGDAGFYGALRSYTYRTRLTRAELAALDAPPFDLRNLPGFRALLPGEQWQCGEGNGWNKQALPYGYRPLLSTGVVDNETEMADGPDPEGWRPISSRIGERVQDTWTSYYRTKKPLPPIPTRRPWTFENGPWFVRVRHKQDSRVTSAFLCSDGYWLLFGIDDDSETFTFASMLENFECLDGEPCGTVVLP